MYCLYIKRFIDICLSILATVCLSPIFFLLIILGWFKMKGNPFFLQERPGKNEKIFKLIKFRTMTCEKDINGNLLPDHERLVPYGRFLRSTSLDELPELLNIIKGDMAIVGPRPLLVKYLPLYNEEQRHRHDVLPGLTGLAQVSGRNQLTWEDKFRIDVEYVRSISFMLDAEIIARTILAVFKREGINSATCDTMEPFKGTAATRRQE